MALADPTLRGARPRTEAFACAVVALLAGLFYFWSVGQPTGNIPFATRIPNGYYALQAAGYRSGHLYLARDVNPALLALKDPYDPVANAPYRVHDLSLYRGRYYMYFGATPAVLLFWPVAALTGWYLTDQFAVAFFCTGTVWVGIMLLLAARRRYFPAARSWQLALGAVCLAFATPITTLAEGPQFYQVPISCGIFLQALMLVAAYKSLHSARRATWLSLAGLALGLSFGARPNYLLSSLALLVPIAYAVQDRKAGSRGLGVFFRWSFVAFAPTFLCGVALVAYNRARFGSLGEFGMHYQLAGERFTNLRTVSPAFVLPHYWDYLLGRGLWQSYFPFFSPFAGKPFGIIRYLPWTLLAAFAFMRFPASAGRRWFALTLGVAAWSNLTLLSGFFGTTARYPGDFTQALLLLAALGALCVGEWASAASGRRWASTLLCLLGGISLLFSAAVYFSGFPGQYSFLGLARAANLPYYEWRQLHNGQSSGLRLEVVLPANLPTQAEPLLETGRQADQRDWLQIECLGGTKARLSFFHAGTGLFDGKEFDIPADRKISVAIRAGSLCPPFSYPSFSSWSSDEYESARRKLQVDVNGSRVLDIALDCYEASPSDLRIGRLKWFSGGMGQEFSGTITSVTSLPIERPAPDVPQFASAAPIEISVILPLGKTGGADPLLVSGRGSKSDLVYCIYDGLNRVKFSIDHWGNGGPRSESVTYDPLLPHKITILDGAIAGVDQGRFAVLFDGRPLINTTQLFYPTTPDTVLLGYNKFGSTGAGRQFSGSILGSRQVSADSIPPLEVSGSYGPVELSLVFPFDVSGTNEPLVVTGKTGAGDFVYVRYLDANHVSFGFDHWAVGGVESQPVEVSYADTHHISIVIGSLFPAGSTEHDSRRLQILMDGRPVLEGTKDTYPSRAEEVEIAKNAIGGSTCGVQFTGRILSLARHRGP